MVRESINDAEPMVMHMNLNFVLLLWNSKLGGVRLRGDHGGGKSAGW